MVWLRVCENVCDGGIRGRCRESVGAGAGEGLGGVGLSVVGHGGPSEGPTEGPPRALERMTG